MASHQRSHAADHNVAHAALNQDGLYSQPSRRRGQVHHIHEIRANCGWGRYQRDKSKSRYGLKTLQFRR
jgi:hypothetical protein